MDLFIYYLFFQVGKLNIDGTRGCNCKKSSCLKKYCQCYEAYVRCNKNCRCIGCRNTEDRKQPDSSPEKQIRSKFTLDNNSEITQPEIYDFVQSEPIELLESVLVKEEPEDFESESDVIKQEPMDFETSENMSNHCSENIIVEPEIIVSQVDVNLTVCSDANDFSDLECTICGVRFVRKAYLQQHILSVHEKKKPYDCDKCDARFSENSKLRRHINIVHEKKVPIENLIVCSDANDFSNHECEFCGLKFAKISHLQEHTTTVHEKQKPFKCDICDSKFSVNSKLNRHIRTVHEEKKVEPEVIVSEVDVSLTVCSDSSDFSNLECTTCGMRFAKKSHLQEHIISVHEKKKPFACHKCDSRFSGNSNLRAHINTVHENKRPHKCFICGMGFIFPIYLQRHIWSVHDKEKPFSCEECGSRFGTKGNLNVHLKAQKCTKKKSYTERFEKMNAILEPEVIVSEAGSTNSKIDSDTNDSTEQSLVSDSYKVNEKIILLQENPGISESTDNFEKPKMSRAQLIAEALMTAPDGTMSLPEIYQSISTRHPYYKMKLRKWQNAIRHTLSIDKSFMRATNESTCRYWKLSKNPSNKVDEKISLFEENPGISESSNFFEKPKMSRAQLIAEALANSPDGQLILTDIYKSINANHPYYKMKMKDWQNSIRHTLSINKSFMKANDQSHFWIMDLQNTSKKIMDIIKESKESFPCTLCNASFSRKIYVKRHIETVHDVKKALVQCPSLNCPYKTANSQDFANHIATVHEGKIIVCSAKKNDLDPRNVYSDNLNGENNLEGQMAPLPPLAPPALSNVHCPSLQCDYKTTDREELENHVSTVHEGKKFPSGLKNAARPDIYASKVRKSVFTCHVCNSSYSSMVRLNSHFTSVHGIGRKKPLPCSICHDFFADRFALLDHKLSHIGNPGNNFKKNLKIENDGNEYDEGVDPLAM